MQKALSIKNNMAELDRMNDFLEAAGESFGLNLAFMTKLYLVMEEAMSNVVFYAYKPGETNRPIDIVLSYEDDCLTVTLADMGIPFDPTAKKDPDITLPGEDRPIGGLGIFLIKQIMDEVIYRRDGERNILTMKKKLKV